MKICIDFQHNYIPAFSDNKFFIPKQFYNPALQIGMEDIKNAWFLPAGSAPVKLNTLVYQGQLTFRFPASGKRISYRQLKKGLVKKVIFLYLPVDMLPF
jgi:hypothetical protein